MFEDSRMAGPGCWSRDQLLSLNLDAFLSLYKENEFPLELGRHLSLDQVCHQDSVTDKISNSFICLLAIVILW